MDETHSFGYWVRCQHKALDLTQKELVQRAACSLSAIKKIEGDTRCPSRELAEILAGCLNVPEAERQSFLRIARGLAPVDELRLAGQPLAPATRPQLKLFRFNRSRLAICRPQRVLSSAETKS